MGSTLVNIFEALSHATWQSVTVWLLISLIGLLIALWSHITFWGWYYRRGQLDGERHWVKASDGWRLALERHPLPEGLERAGVALCCPGLACNGRIFHLREDVSFARGLQERGYEVWILHPRGTGPSERPLGKGEWGYGHSDYLKDGIAALRYVYHEAGEAPLWVGHSMGGLIGYEVAGIAPHKLRGLVTLGTPTDLSHHTISPFYFFLFKYFCKGLDTAYLGKLSTLVAPWAGWIPSLTPDPLYVNLNLLPPDALRAFLAQAIEDTPRQLLDEFVNAVYGRGPLSEEGWTRYKRLLAGIQVPIFAVMSNQDGLAPLEVTSAIKRWGPEGLLETLELTGYGHGELAVSLSARALITEEVARWAQRATRRRLRKRPYLGPPRIARPNDQVSEQEEP